MTSITTQRISEASSSLAPPRREQEVTKPRDKESSNQSVSSASAQGARISANDKAQEAKDSRDSERDDSSQQDEKKRESRNEESKSRLSISA